VTIVSLITVAEADTFNALSNDWLFLSSAEKSAYIFNASIFMQTGWSCIVDGATVDWEDPTTLNEDLKRACAYYAEADRIGVLFDPMEKEDIHGKKVMEKRRVDTLEKTTQWSMFGAAVNGNPLDSVDAIMKVYCEFSLRSSEAIRV